MQRERLALKHAQRRHAAASHLADIFILYPFQLPHGKGGIGERNEVGVYCEDKRLHKLCCGSAEFKLIGDSLALEIFCEQLGKHRE